MASKSLPKCFISYCHENADFASIEAFEKELEVISKGAFEILRDQSNLNVGERISEHEKEIEHSDIVIILCTPQYKHKVINRAPGGVYREYKMILNKYNTYIGDIKEGKSVKTFALIPILFAGTHTTAILDDVTDNLYEDFTKYSCITDKSGFEVVPTYVQKLHAQQFSEIRSKFENVKHGLDVEFKKNYHFWLDLLFLQDKHEVLRGKYRFNGVEDVLTELFVKTKSYFRVIDGDKCILIGRKGSGKSTIVDHFHRGQSETYKPPIAIIVDNFDLSFLYNFVATKAHNDDIGDVVREETYFEACWQIYIYQQCIYTLVDEELYNNSVNDLRPYIKTLIETSSKRRDTKWAQFVDTCSLVSEYINRSIEESHPSQNFYSVIADKSTIPSIVKGVLGEDILNALKGCVKMCTRKFIFALDGFDQRFEDNRTASIAASNSQEDKNSRIKFEINWLKGLLRSILSFRSVDGIMRDSIDFCVTIPQDRYLEARRSERDDFRFRALAADLQWSAVELSILARKRLEGLVNFQSNTGLPPLDRLNEILESEGLDLPTKIEMKVDGNSLSISIFKYLLRHTFWRPRDILFYFAALLANKKFAQKHSHKIDHGLVKEIVSRTTYDVIDTEFIKEYQNSIVNLKSIIESFESSEIILEFSQVDSILSRQPFSVSGGLIRVDDILEKIDILYEIGFLGIELDQRQIKSKYDNKDMFMHSDGSKKYGAISDQSKKKSRFVIHPMFVEYLLLNTDVGRIVCVYTDEYIQRNDILNE